VERTCGLLHCPRNQNPSDVSNNRQDDWQIILPAAASAKLRPVVPLHHIEESDDNGKAVSLPPTITQRRIRTTADDDTRVYDTCFIATVLGLCWSEKLFDVVAKFGERGVGDNLESTNAYARRDLRGGGCVGDDK
jgi:hypothetical protein